MPRYRTVLLLHTTADGSHYDWLLDPPVTLPQRRLWTVRLPLPSWQWSVAGTWPAQPIAPHRRAYLTCQGPIPGDRGAVTRVDEGWYVPGVMHTFRLVADVTMRHIRHRIELHRVPGGSWRARVRHSVRIAPGGASHRMVGYHNVPDLMARSADA